MSKRATGFEPVIVALDSFELEQHLLGALMRAAGKGFNLTYDVLPVLKAADRFADRGHQAIFETIIDLAAKGHAPTSGRIINTLELGGSIVAARPDRSSASDPREYIRSLAAATTIRDDRELKLAAEQLAQFWALRQMHALLAESHAEVSGGVVDIRRVVTDCMTGMWRILDGGSERQTAYNAEEATGLTRAAEKALEDTEVAARYLRTGLNGVDAKLQKRVRPGNMVMLLAHAKVGKSVAACKILRTMGWRGNAKPVLISFEMSPFEVQQRIEAAEARVPYELLDDPCELSDEHVNRLETFREEVEQRPDAYHIVAAAGWDDAQVVSALRKYAMMHGSWVAFIDYVQLVRLPKGHSRERELGAFSAMLKGLAEELGMIIIPLAQFNDEMFKRAHADQVPRPIAKDVRECKQMAMDANLSIVIDRPEQHGYSCFHDDEPCKGLARWDLQLGRKIPGGWTTVEWKGEYQDFYNHIPGLEASERYEAARMAAARYEPMDKDEEPF